MRTFLAAVLIFFAGQASALSVADYVRMHAAAQEGDASAGRLLESYVAGVTETVLTTHAMRPIPGLCFPKGVEIRVRDVYPMTAVVMNTSIYRRLDRSRIPFAKLVIDALSVRYPCS